MYMTMYTTQNWRIRNLPHALDRRSTVELALALLCDIYQSLLGDDMTANRCSVRRRNEAKEKTRKQRASEQSRAKEKWRTADNKRLDALVKKRARAVVQAKMV
jgi:hypothetical protein